MRNYSRSDEMKINELGSDFVRSDHDGCHMDQIDEVADDDNEWRMAV